MQRRTFLGVAGVAVAGSATLLASTRPWTRAAPVVGLDGRLSQAERALVEGRVGRPDRELPVEIVRSWRSELRGEVAAGRPLEAFTRWDLALVLAGLAREEGFAFEQHQLAQSVFRTSIVKAV